MWLSIRTARSYFSVFQRMGSLRSPQMMDLVSQFPSSLNVLADAGSRDKPSVTDNCLDPETLSFCFGLAGLRSSVAVDLCATRENTRCSLFVSPCIDNSPRC